MIDPVGAALDAVATRSAFAYPLLFAAGAVTAIGPCAAPRFVAVAALTGSARRPAPLVAAFAAGVAAAYVALGFAADALASLWHVSRAIYLALAVALAVGALVVLLRDESHEHARCAARRTSIGRPSAGGAFLLGASSALIVAPCCTPVVAGIAGLSIAGGRTADGALLLAAFACGHVAPVLATGAFASRIVAALRPLTSTGAPAVVTGGLMLALAAYYGALA